MKTAYTPDNTRSSIAILLSLAVVIIAVAAVIGLSDKPDVSTIVISPAGEPPSIAAPANNFGFGSEDDTTDAATSDAVELDEFGEPFEATATNDDAAADASGEASTDAAALEAEATPEREVILVPPSEPTPTPEVAAAVVPTPVPEQDDESTTDSSTALTPALPTSAGTVQGSFFTKGDENDGAIVSQNLITVSFAPDGSGAFQGVLDITYVDGTHILLNMSGPLTWAASNPQVEAVLEGAFTLDAPIDTDDVTSTDAKLSISSLGAGSGSLCTPKCFGFTFPPQ